MLQKYSEDLSVTHAIGPDGELEVSKSPEPLDKSLVVMIGLLILLFLS